MKGRPTKYNKDMQACSALRVAEIQVKSEMVANQIGSDYSRQPKANQLESESSKSKVLVIPSPLPIASVVTTI